MDDEIPVVKRAAGISSLEDGVNRLRKLVDVLQAEAAELWINEIETIHWAIATLCTQDRQLAERNQHAAKPLSILEFRAAVNAAIATLKGKPFMVADIMLLLPATIKGSRVQRYLDRLVSNGCLVKLRSGTTPLALLSIYDHPTQEEPCTRTPTC